VNAAEMRLLLVRMVSFGLLRYLTQNQTISTSALRIFPDFSPPISPSSGYSDPFTVTGSSWV
jgi:hypothetical protein